MDTLKAIWTRKSTRNYKPEQIPEDVLETILKAGCAAPAAMARYDAMHITVVQKQELLDRINQITAEAIFKASGEWENTDFGAKTLLLVSSTPIHRVGTDHANVGIVVENMVLAATDLGVDSLILGAAPCAVAQDTELMKALKIPEGYTPLLGVFLGYGAEETPVREHTIAITRV